MEACREYYSLDPAHSCRLPNFAFDATLLKNDVEIIEQISDKEVYDKIERV